MIQNGDEVVDRFSEFRGTVIARTEHASGAIQVLVQPRQLVEGKLNDPLWFDEGRVEKVTVSTKPIGFEPNGSNRT